MRNGNGVAMGSVSIENGDLLPKGQRDKGVKYHIHHLKMSNCVHNILIRLKKHLKVVGFKV